MILFINACVRKDSRTKILADCLLSKMKGDTEEVCLEKVNFPVTDEQYLNKRQACIEKGDFSDPMFDLAKQFAKADTIVIGAPYWDLSFPASLKQYIEHINVIGITFGYTPEGQRMGLCKSDTLYYVTTAGGTFVPEEFGYGYIKTMAREYYGIRNIKQIKAVGLDLDGYDAKAIMAEAIQHIKENIQV